MAHYEAVIAASGSAVHCGSTKAQGANRIGAQVFSGGQRKGRGCCTCSRPRDAILFLLLKPHFNMHVLLGDAAHDLRTTLSSSSATRFMLLDP
jgi:hypothetical protein